LIEAHLEGNPDGAVLHLDLVNGKKKTRNYERSLEKTITKKKTEWPKTSDTEKNL